SQPVHCHENYHGRINKEKMMSYKNIRLMFITILTIIVSATGVRATPEDLLVTPELRSDIFTYRFISETDDASALFVNPAGLGVRENGSTILRGSYEFDRLNEFTLGFSGPKIGLGYTRIDNGFYKSYTYHLGFGGKIFPGFYVGSSYLWHHSNLELNKSPFAMDIGFIARPHRYISIGGVWNNTNRSRFNSSRLEDTFTGGISFRPLTDRITISGQAMVAEGSGPCWQFGGSFDLLPGLEVFGSYIKNLSLENYENYEEFSAGIALTFGSVTTREMTRSRVNGNLDYSRYSFAIENAMAYRKDALVQKHRFSEITIGGNYEDEGGKFQLMGNGNNNLHSILGRLESVRMDKDTDGLLLKIKGLSGGFIGPVSANLYEIRQAIEKISNSGKPVVAYLMNATASELYLASAADKIVVPNQTTIGMIGVSVEINRLKRMFEKLGIEWDHTTAGDYKSTFHMMYTDTSTSVQKEELQGLVNEVYTLLVDAIAEGRGIDPDKMRELADGQLFTSKEAVENNLVDAVGWEKTAKTELGKLAELSKPEKLKTVPSVKRKYWNKRWSPPPAIAVVGAYGSIAPGKSKLSPLNGGRTMGSESVVKSLKKASKYSGVKAIVFRVDSGGGSALASDEILNEIKRIQREEKIPVIVSMSNLAGSGGYWISMYADKIFADPFTITGSIGVVLMKPVLKQLYEKIGITHEIFKSGKHADAMSTARHFTDEEQKIINKFIDKTYDEFVSEVATGRKIKKEKVYKLAGGRLYFGTQALDINLIDKLGGLKDAIEYAAENAGIENDYETLYFPAFGGFLFDRLSLSPVGIFNAARMLWADDKCNFDKTVTIDK
ncbi:signal peptide peptidase SppA, partial [bacterium]|nr:signal peptide peptidase SppA [bacterium]